MPDIPQQACDVLIFGGGVAGLWAMHTLQEAGYHVLLVERHALGAGQTVASQGIIHGGLKYTLRGMFNESARAIRDMPQHWRDCLAGSAKPSLQSTTVRADWCALWRTSSLKSQLGMVGARSGLRVKPAALSMDQVPVPLRQCPGEVFRLDEQVIDPVSMIRSLAEPHTGRMLRVDDADDAVRFDVEDGTVRTVVLRHGHDRLNIRPRAVVLTAGGGNALLRTGIGLSEQAMQRRPLHMVMMRGALPVLNGHCVDGATTRVTITTTVDAQGRTVWQLGGQMAEEGVNTDRAALITHANAELRAVLPGFDPGDVEWGTYRVDRAEGANHGKRPEDAVLLHEGQVLTAWPTKLVLAPVLAARILEAVRSIAPPSPSNRNEIPSGWTRPDVAAPPWELEANWNSDH